jgi:hypothetical protein
MLQNQPTSLSSSALTGNSAGIRPSWSGRLAILWKVSDPFDPFDPSLSLPNSRKSGFWLSLASQDSKSHEDLKDGIGHSWPEYGPEDEKMVLFGDAEGGAAKVVPGDYFDGVYMCDSADEE